MQAGIQDLFMTLALFPRLTYLGLDVSVPTDWVSGAFLPGNRAQPLSAMTALLAWYSIP